MTVTRRKFLATAAAATLATRVRAATTLHLPLGLQLYSVRDQMKDDFAGTLAKVRSLGYTEVESAALPKLKASELRAALDAAGLKCVSAHHPFGELRGRVQEVADFDAALGVSSIVCASPGRRIPPPPSSHGDPTLDDWRFNAEQFNLFGEQIAKHGLRFGYHNHTADFAPLDGVVPYFELMRLCDPKKVRFELDCGWAAVSGQDPAALMQRFPQRIVMLHVKDFQLPPNPSPEKRADAKVVELGRGSVDYRPIFAAAAKYQQIDHVFVEQEEFILPWQESLKVDADYLHGLR